MTARTLSLLTFLALAVPASGLEFYLSPDTPTDLTGAGLTLPWNIVRGDTTTNSYVAEPVVLPFTAAVDGLHRMSSGDWLFSVTANADLGGTTYLAHDVIRLDPAGPTYSYFFCGAFAGLGPSANIDALYLRGGDAGTLVVSFDVPTAIGGVEADPADLIEFRSTGATCADWAVNGILYDASAANPPIFFLVDLTAAAEDAVSGMTLLSFDTPVTVSGNLHLPGTLFAFDGTNVVPFYRDPAWPVASRVNALATLGGVMCVVPTGVVGNDIRAGKDVLDVVLSWPTATVSPANFAIYRTTAKRELDETPAGIGDEMSLGVQTMTSYTDLGALATPPSLYHYKVLPADSCGGTVYP